MRKENILGKYYTQINVFDNPVFINWVKKHNLDEMKILEPFAGKNSLIDMMAELNLLKNGFSSFDINPDSKHVKFKDTFKKFPKGYEFCLTNPPFLGKNIAGKLGYETQQSFGLYQDLYEVAVNLMLENCDYVAAIIPMSFIKTPYFKSRLEIVIELPYKKLFKETEHPVCLCLWTKEEQNSYNIYRKNEYIGNSKKLLNLKSKILHIKSSQYSDRIKFHDKTGNISLMCIDATDKNKKIKFQEGLQIKHLPNGNMQRSRLLFSVLDKNNHIISEKEIIPILNAELQAYREKTKDVFLVAYKGINQEDVFRRRLDFETAREIVAKALFVFDKTI